MHKTKILEKEHRLYEIMKASAFSKEGFLGCDTREIKGIISDDLKVLCKLCSSCSIIATKMMYLTELGEKGFGSSIKVNDDFKVIVDDYKGLIPCPFGDCYNSRKSITTAINTKTNEIYTWSYLNIHLIEVHDFFEGSGSPYRIDPIIIVKFLNL